MYHQIDIPHLPPETAQQVLKKEKVATAVLQPCSFWSFCLGLALPPFCEGPGRTPCSSVIGFWFLLGSGTHRRPLPTSSSKAAPRLTAGFCRTNPLRSWYTPRSVQSTVTPVMQVLALVFLNAAVERMWNT